MLQALVPDAAPSFIWLNVLQSTGSLALTVINPKSPTATVKARGCRHEILV
jgi:hypothetical protein